MAPKLSVVVCTFNRAGRLKQCLDSLTKQTFKNFEVVIIDGGSTDKTNEIINQYSKKLKVNKFGSRKLEIDKFLFKEKELAKVRDQGWRKAKGELVAWIDDDVIADKNWAKAVVDTFENDPKIAGVSGPTIIPKKLLKNRDVFSFYQPKGIYKILAGFWEKFFLEGKKYQVGQILKSGAWTPGSNFKRSLKIKGLKDVDYLEACNMTLKRDLVKRVNGFDFGFTGVGEWSELDLAMRVKKLGYRLVFNPKARVNHYISQSGVYPRRAHAQQRMENFFRFYFRHIFKPKINYIFKFSLYLVFLNLYWANKALTTKNINWLSGWIGTLTGLTQIGDEKK